ncbi:MAG: 1-acyl-sn-glycerol-3-phosphate acyltransferase, partial [Candidatus Dormibacteraceae bacterium]
MAEHYQGREYRQALGGGGDQLDPLRPPRLYRLLVAILRFTVSKLFRFQVVGLELVPAPPFLIASNHQAWYDALFIIAALTRQGRLPMI